MQLKLTEAVRLSRAVCILSLLFVNSARAAFVEGAPHAPNFVGRNICLGIQAEPKASPIVEVTHKLGSNETVYKILSASGSRLSVEESIVDKAVCNGLPINTAQWNGRGEANFCLSAWDAGKYIRVKFLAPHASVVDLSSLYAIAACKLGDHPDEPQYGDILKIDRGIPVLLP